MRHLGLRLAADITALLWPAALALAAAAASAQPAAAGVLSFAFNPNGAAPSLAGSGTAFTATGISVGSYLTAVNQSDASFVVHQYLPVTGFTLNGVPVAAPGPASLYGLYFEITASGTMPIYNSVAIALKADPGNQDGSLVATASGVGFTNTGATGEANDITLATGSLVSAALSLNPATGVRNNHTVETFSLAPGETGFFSSPSFDASVLLDLQLTTPPSTFTAVPGPGGTTINYVNGAFGTVEFVPEPASIVVFGTGLIGLVSLRYRFRRSPQV